MPPKASYKGGRLVAYKKDGVVLEEGIYMPDGTNIEPQMRPLYAKMAIQESEEIEVTLNKDGHVKVEYIGWPEIKNRKQQRQAANKAKAFPPVILDGHIWCYQCWKNNTLIHWIPRPAGQEPNMAAKEYGYCDHCNGNHARRNEASRELTQAQRDERRAEEVAALSDAAVSLLTSQQVAVSNEYDRRLEEAVQGNFAMSSIQGKLRNAFWGAHGQGPVASSSSAAARPAQTNRARKTTSKRTRSPSPAVEQEDEDEEVEEVDQTPFYSKRTTKARRIVVSDEDE